MTKRERAELQSMEQHPAAIIRDFAKEIIAMFAKGSEHETNEVCHNTITRFVALNAVYHCPAERFPLLEKLIVDFIDGKPASRMPEERILNLANFSTTVLEKCLNDPIKATDAEQALKNAALTERMKQELERRKS